MEVISEGITWHRNIVSVVCNLVRVHNSSGDFNRADKVEEVVAQVVSELFNLLLCHVGAICDYEVVDGKSSRDRCLVSDHVEIEACLITRVLNQTLVNNGAWSGVLIFVVALLSESSVYSLVD